MVTLCVTDFGQWRDAARRLLADATPPSAVAWLPTADALPFADEPAQHRDAQSSPRPWRVPRAFVTLAESVALHRSHRKWDVLYRVLWRLLHEDRHLLEHDSDDDVRVAKDLAHQVRRDEHKMHAFVRFTPVEQPDGVRYVAWYEPDHLIVPRVALFFAERFSGMTWSIFTPDLSAHWDGAALTYSAGVITPPAGDPQDIVTDLWRTYYASIFNPARVNPRAMQRDMPVRRWRTLPEATLIPQLVASAQEQTTRTQSERRVSLTARPFVPAAKDLQTLRVAAPGCRGCALYEPATQVVFGEGPADARLVLVGEQPGDVEDVAGRPFVGPAGDVLDRALAAAGIDRRRVYLTNAVKHFSFEPRGKRRIHQTPRLSEMQACRPWLEAELQAIRPVTIVALGSTAARTLIGPQARVMAMRGRVLEGLSWAPRVIVTVHPSAVLRSDDADGYFDMLVADLRLASELPPPNPG